MKQATCTAVCEAQGLPISHTKAGRATEQAAGEAGSCRVALCPVQQLPCGVRAEEVNPNPKILYLPGRAGGGGVGRRSWCRRAGAFPPGTWAAAACASRCRPRRRSRHTACSGAAPSAATCSSNLCHTSQRRPRHAIRRLPSTACSGAAPSAATCSASPRQEVPLKAWSCTQTIPPHSWQQCRALHSDLQRQTTSSSSF